MNSATRAFQAADDGRLELESVLGALSAQFAVTTGPQQLVRRRRLDTFDRRLDAAGLTLEHQLTAARDPDRSGERLVLGWVAGTPSVAVPVERRLRWPATAGALPPGPVRDSVAPVIGIRALMVSSDQRRRVRRLDLRNEDGKTVARVELDEPASTSGVPTLSTLPAQLTVRRLRGYDDEARRADRLLLGLGLRGVDGGGNSEPRSAPKMLAVGREAPARVLLAAALSAFLESMRENLPGLLDDVDTEFLHDFRVAVRRTRATLKLGRPALPPALRRDWEPAFKSVGDLTTPVRDLDVYELDLPVMSRWLLTTDPADLDPFVTHLRSRRTAARIELVAWLRSARFRRLMTEWGQELSALPDLRDPDDQVREPDAQDLSAGQLADHSISAAYRRVTRDGALIGADSPAEDLHELRKRCKELRYALEVFASLIDPAVRRRAVSDLKGLQDVLGRFQDSEVQRRALQGFAGEMMAEGAAAGAILAMGELIGHLDVEQDRARREFDVAFASFERPSSLHLMHRLGSRQ